MPFHEGSCSVRGGGLSASLFMTSPYAVFVPVVVGGQGMKKDAAMFCLVGDNRLARGNREAQQQLREAR